MKLITINFNNIISHNFLPIIIWFLGERVGSNAGQISHEYPETKKIQWSQLDMAGTTYLFGFNQIPFSNTIFMLIGLDPSLTIETKLYPEHFFPS